MGTSLVEEGISGEPDSSQIQMLKTRFGIDHLKDEQWQAIKCLLYDKRDCFIRANSRYPKEVIYQFVTIESQQTTVVFTISEMRIKILAEDLTQKRIGSHVMNKQIHLSGPEQLHNHVVIVNLDAHLKTLQKQLKLLQTIGDRIGLFVIDECHSISALSHKFRQNHQTALQQLKKDFVNIPILCISSVATNAIQCNVSDLLNLQDPLIIKTDMNIPNVKLTKDSVYKNIGAKIEINQLIESIVKATDCIIVITESRVEAQSLSLKFESSRFYHAGLDKTQRQRIAGEFRSKQFNVLFTTEIYPELVRDDIRHSIITFLPNSLEKYYEIMDATGRDGLASCCTFICHKSYQSLNPQSESERKVLDLIDSKVKCRRQVMLAHMDPVEPAEISDRVIRESCCDACEAEIYEHVPGHLLFHDVDADGMIDITDDARILLELMKLALKCRQTSARCVGVVDFLCGIRFPEAHLYPLSFFGKGSRKSSEYWRALWKVFEDKKMIDICHRSRDKVLSEKAKSFLHQKSQKLTIYQKQYTCRKFLKRNDQVYELHYNSLTRKYSYNCVSEEQKSDEITQEKYNQPTHTPNKRRHSVDEAGTSSTDLFSFPTKSKRIKPAPTEIATEPPTNIDHDTSSIDSENWDDEYVDNLRSFRIVDEAKTASYMELSGIISEDEEYSLSQQLCSTEFK